MREWNENRLNEELEVIIQEIPGQEDLEKKIIQSMNRRIRRIVLRTVAGIAGVLVMVFFILSPLMDRMYLDPYVLNREPEQKMLEVLRDFCETTSPYREIVSLSVQRKGFARYTLEMQAADVTEPLVFGRANVWCELNRGKYENIVDPGMYLSHHLGRFGSQSGDQTEIRCELGKKNQSEDQTDSQSDIIANITELPASAMLYLSISDTKPKGIEELRNAPVTLEWLQVYQPNADFQGGLGMQVRSAYEKDDKRDQMTEQELLAVYISHLENLLEYEEVWEEFGLSDGRNTVYEKEALIKTYEDAKQLTSLTSKNYCISGKRDEVVQFLQENKLDSVFIEKVRLW